MRLYPPLLFQRIWVKRFHRDFKGVDVKIAHSILNRNYNSSIFGGTIYSACDPFFAVLYDQIFRKQGYQTKIWLKSASIEYLKPGRTALYFSLRLTDQDIEQAKQGLDTAGKFIHTFPIEIKDKHGEVYAKALHEIYIRNLKYNRKQPVMVY